MNSSRRPSLLWRLFVLLGVGTLAAVSFSDTAWERWRGVLGDTVPRDTIRNVTLGTVGLHAVEASAAFASAKRNDVPQAGRWALSTLVWGFPVLRRLRKAKAAA